MSADWTEDKRKIRLLEWLTTTPAVREELGWPDSKNKLAVEIGISAKTLREWQAVPAFRAHWEKTAKDIVGSPERVQTLLEDLYQAALDPNEKRSDRSKAADLFLKATDMLKPPAADMAAKKAAEMSDAELDAMIAEAAAKEQKQRSEAKR